MTCGKVRRDKKRVSSPFLPGTCSRERRRAIFKNGGFLVRECATSLQDSQLIGPSDFFGPRSKVVLRIEDYTWALVSGSFDKLHEVGVLSYFVYS